jgi:hypothetical protein
VDERYRPLPELLTDHLAQGVWRYCLFPGWKPDNQQLSGAVDFVSEATEGISPEDDECQDYDSADSADLTDRLQELNLETRAGPSGTTRAYAQIVQFSMKEREYGEGKAAFENYLAASIHERHCPRALASKKK